MSSARRGGGGRSRSLASRFRRSRSSSGSAATCNRRAWRPCWIIRPGSTRPSLRPRRCGFRRRNWPRPMPRPIRSCFAAVRRIAQNIREFQQAILHRDVRLERPGGYLAERVSAAGSRGHLRAGRGRRVSLDRADDGRARPSGRRARAGRRRPADEVRGLQRRHAGHLPRAWRQRGLSPRRRAGGRGAGLRRRGDSAGGQDRRAGQSLRGAGQAARFRRGGHRLDRRPERGRGDRR